MEEQKTEVFIAVRHRASGSSSVYFGPFNSLEEISKFAKDNHVMVGAIKLVSPDSDPNTWWL